MGGVNPGAQLGRSLLNPGKSNEANTQAIHRRLSALERFLQPFKKELLVVEDTQGTAQMRELLTNGGGPTAPRQTCPLGSISGKKIAPGFITGGGSSIELKHENLIAAANSYVYVKVDWSGNVEDGVLLQGGTMTGASIEVGQSVPSDNIPTATASTGAAYVPLGSWDAGSVWQPAGCGSISIAFCPGAFKHVRG